MAKKILSVGFEIPGSQIKNVSLNTRNSLLDSDIAIFDPDIGNLYSYSGSYLGKHCLSDSDSFQLKETIEHWRREIQESIHSGKTVFIFLNALKEVYVATGQKSFSGTGRNRVTIRDVKPCNNYELIPLNIDVINAEGASIKLQDKNNLFSSYWRALNKYSEYRTLIDGENLQPIFITSSGDKIVGAYVQHKASGGALILLPYIDFEKEEFSYEKGGEDYWRKAAVTLGKILISCLVEIDKSIKKEGEHTPSPEWAKQTGYILPKEKEINEELLKVETKINKLQKDKEKQHKILENETMLKWLLYEKGKPLEKTILEVLKILGFSASPYQDSESEFDVVFECKEGRLIGEVEGKDNKPINIDKMRQLEANIHEDFAREKVTEIAKGVLFGNAYRLDDPQDRGDFFTKKCCTAAKRTNTALIKTTDLFKIAQFLSGDADKVFAKKCRQLILNTTGIVKFPDLPSVENKKQKISNKNT